MLGDPREDLFFVVHLVSECLRGSSVLTKVETSLTKKKKKVKIMEVALLLFEDLPCFFLESFPSRKSLPWNFRQILTRKNVLAF